MNIGFDAKRAFHNSRGLGNYSRDMIRILSSFYPEHTYFLFNPDSKKNISFPLPVNSEIVTPLSIIDNLFPSLWRSKHICNQIKSNNIEVYHGLSQELPHGINKTGAKSIVSMHDAIFMRYPELYASSYRTVFIKKNQYACKSADVIIAISEQTKRDLIHFFNADEDKIEVVYQSCNSIFRQNVSSEKIDICRNKYNLPPEYILTVGAIEKRKNTALIVEAMYRAKINIPLVIVGKPTKYKDDIIALVEKYKFQNRIYFIHNVETIDLPAIYKMASIFIFPSLFEGFGIPILEALCVGVPIITSKDTCFEEVGGPSSIYIDPKNAEELGFSIQSVLDNTKLREKMITDGHAFSENFTDEKAANNLMKIYSR